MEGPWDTLRGRDSVQREAAGSNASRPERQRRRQPRRHRPSSVSCSTPTCHVSETRTAESRSCSALDGNWHSSPPQPPADWALSFSQLRRQWSEQARCRGSNDHLQPLSPSPGDIRVMFGRATISAEPEYSLSGPDPLPWTAASMPAPTVVERVDEIRRWQDAIRPGCRLLRPGSRLSVTAACDPDSSPPTSVSTEPAADDFSDEERARLESALRRSFLLDDERHRVVSAIVRGYICSASRKPQVESSILRRSYLTPAERVGSVLSALCCSTELRQPERQAVAEAVIQTYISDPKRQRHLLRSTIKSLRRSDAGHNRSLKKSLRQIERILQNNSIGEDETRVEIESTLRSSSLNPEDTRSVLETALRNIKEDPIKRSVMGSMLRRSIMSPEEKRDIITNTLRESPLDPQFKEQVIDTLLNELPREERRPVRQCPTCFAQQFRNNEREIPQRSQSRGYCCGNTDNINASGGNSNFDLQRSSRQNDSDPKSGCPHRYVQNFCASPSLYKHKDEGKGYILRSRNTSFHVDSPTYEGRDSSGDYSDGHCEEHQVPAKIPTTGNLPKTFAGNTQERGQSFEQYPVYRVAGHEKSSYEKLPELPFNLNERNIICYINHTSDSDALSSSSRRYDQQSGSASSSPRQQQSDRSNRNQSPVRPSHHSQDNPKEPICSCQQKTRDEDSEIPKEPEWRPRKPGRATEIMNKWKQRRSNPAQRSIKPMPASESQGDGEYIDLEIDPRLQRRRTDPYGVADGTVGAKARDSIFIPRASKASDKSDPGDARQGRDPSSRSIKQYSGPEDFVRSSPTVSGHDSKRSGRSIEDPVPSPRPTKESSGIEDCVRCSPGGSGRDSKRSGRSIEDRVPSSRPTKESSGIEDFVLCSPADSGRDSKRSDRSTEPRVCRSKSGRNLPDKSCYCKSEERSVETAPGDKKECYNQNCERSRKKELSFIDEHPTPPSMPRTDTSSKQSGRNIPSPRTSPSPKYVDASVQCDCPESKRKRTGSDPSSRPGSDRVAPSSSGPPCPRCGCEATRPCFTPCRCFFLRLLQRVWVPWLLLLVLWFVFRPHIVPEHCFWVDSFKELFDF